MFFGVEDLKTDEIFLKLTKTCEEQPEISGWNHDWKMRFKDRTQ